MLESVNSSVSNSALVRSQAVQQSSAIATSGESTDSAPPVAQAPYVSPYIGYDASSNRIVLETRNPETGAVISQIPSHFAIEEQERQAAAATQVQNQIQPAASDRSSNAASNTPARQISSASQSSAFGAFARQVSSMQAAIAGGGTGSTVSFLA